MDQVVELLPSLQIPECSNPNTIIWCYFTHTHIDNHFKETQKAFSKYEYSLSYWIATIIFKYCINFTFIGSKMYQLAFSHCNIKIQSLCSSKNIFLH
jgi:hypothetical protein